MIHSIRIQNFLSFEDVTIDFNQGLNVVAGKNGSGKTNLLRALAFLGDLLREPSLAEDTIKKYGGADTLYNSTKKDTNWSSGTYFTFSFSPPRNIPQVNTFLLVYTIEIYYGLPKIHFRENFGLIPKNAKLNEKITTFAYAKTKGVNFNEAVLSYVDYIDLTRLVGGFDPSTSLNDLDEKIQGKSKHYGFNHSEGLMLFKHLPQIRDIKDNTERRVNQHYEVLFFYLKQVFCFSTVNLSSIDAFYKESKSQIVFDNVAKLKSDYSNLIYVLGRLSETDEESFKRVIDAVKRHTIFKDVVEVRPFGKEFKITLIGKGKMHKRPFSFEEFPSGIQNLVAILTAVYSNPPGSLVAIDEPEVFMHTSLIAEMVEELRQSGRVVLISSHQTVTLMSLKKGELIGLKMNPETGCTETIDMTEANEDLDVFDFASQKFSKLLDI